MRLHEKTPVPFSLPRRLQAETKTRFSPAPPGKFGEDLPARRNFDDRSADGHQGGTTVPDYRGVQRAVPNALETTLEYLASTTNEAAVGLLVSAMNSADRNVQAGAVRTLLRRGSPAGQRELIRRWPLLSDRWKSVIADRPGRFSQAVRDAILSPDEPLRAHGCDAALWIRDFDLIPVLIRAAEDKSNPQAERAAQTLLSMCDLLYEEVATSRGVRPGRDLKALREFLVPALEQSLSHFESHKRTEILEAFLLLANRENVFLKSALQNPHDRLFLPAITQLSHSPRPGVIQLLVSFLDDAQAPTAIHQVLARRRDVPFLRHLLRRVGDDPSGPLRANLRRIRSFTWLRDDLAILSALHDQEQYGAVQLAVASGLDRLSVFEVLKYLLAHGGVATRRATVAALGTFRGADANSLILQALSDADPETRALAVVQLRDRGIPGALGMLIELLDSPDPPVREAARNSLSEFRFRRFLDAFETLDSDARRSTGSIVRRVDPQAVTELAAELRAPSRTRRLRALDVAVAMQAVPSVEDELIALLSDDDHQVRAEVLRILAECESPQARRAMRECLLDDNAVVAEAALRTLAEMASAEPAGSIAVPASDLQPDPRLLVEEGAS